MLRWGQNQTVSTQKMSYRFNEASHVAYDYRSLFVIVFLHTQSRVDTFRRTLKRNWETAC